MTKHGLLFLGFDPGADGAFAALTASGKVAHVLPFKKHTEREIADEIGDVWFDADGGFAYMERVSSSPQMGVRSAFSFGRCYGLLRGCLIAVGVPFEEIAPAKWQRALGCRTKGDKNVTKAKAQQLFPGMKITHAIADALLIAEYGRRLRGGML